MNFAIRRCVLIVLVFTGCTYRLPPLSPGVAQLPPRLSQAGLFADRSMIAIAADARPYTPVFELWSDGATKRRWIRLPAGAQIDTSNMDDWSFPVGTELWKEFSVGGRRVETRLLRRIAASEDGWVGVAYVWRADQTDAIARIDGVSDALETSHDVPAARACMTCHGGRSSRVLGFSAIQLAHPASTADELTLARLASDRLVSTPPPAEIRIPGLPTTAQALGYLHVNCGSCHNSSRPAAARYYRPPGTLDVWLDVASLATPEATPAYRSAGRLIIPGDPDASPLLQRMTGASIFSRRMPPVATKTIDTTGTDLLRRWIASLPANRR